jgi:hypothetical protein
MQSDPCVTEVSLHGAIVRFTSHPNTAACDIDPG